MGDLKPAQISARLRRVRRMLQRRKLLRFTEAVKPDYEAQWYHELLAQKLDAVRRGEITRLLVFMPPQHGKSELISRMWPAHLLGTNPDTRIIATSYNADLATFNARAVRKIVKSQAFAETFGDLGLADRRSQQDVSHRISHFEIPGRDGYLRSAGIMGGVTGFGFDVGIIDDPIKNQEEADSDVYRERLKNAFHSVFETRGRGIGKDGIPDRIVGVFTRWHHDDLAGYVLRTAAETGDAWEVLSLPAILDTEPAEYDPRDAGEALWPARYPVELLERRKRGMPLRIWDAMYQQRPSPEAGGIFLRRWWRHFDPREVERWVAEGDFGEMVQSWDLGFKKSGSSRVAGLVGMVRGADVYLLDLVVDHMSYVESKDAIRMVSRRWPQAYTKLVEDKANGPAVISDLARELGGMTPWPPQGEKLDSKESRWNAASPVARAGNVWLPPKIVTWVDEFIEELAALPHGVYDDIADAFAQLIAYHRSEGHVLADLAQW